MRLAQIPKEQYSDYRYDVIFGAYKWDPQVEDHNTISEHVLLIEPSDAAELAALAERLADETVRLEEALARDLRLARPLALPRPISRALARAGDYRRDQHIRLMRFDFHPTPSGWAVSEVNSDVPGGFAEASLLPQIAARHFDGCAPGVHMGDCMLKAFEAKKHQGPVAFVHCTSYADDLQVMQFLSDHFEAHGIDTLMAAPDHIRWQDGRAFCALPGLEQPVGGIVRFFPLEWLANLTRSSRWQRYFEAVTPSCNHPIAMLTQSKRLPLVWDALGVDAPTWKRLLPETRDPREVRHPGDEWIYKPALGRVGEGISIRGAASDKELSKINKAVARHHLGWVAQRRFISQPLVAPDGREYHLCLGVFTVDGRFAGFYGRISPFPRIDARAKDIPVLIADREGGGVT